MKILFITAASGIDYLNDVIFHGLVSLYGDDIIDSNYLWYLSEGDFDTSQLYGKGFTISKTLNDRSHIDRSHITEKIIEHYFDLIIYGSIWRYDDYYDTVKQYYSENEIIILDGEDNSIINLKYEKGIYFKRELHDYSFINNDLRIFPISFSIPESKFMQINQNKIYWIAPMNPGDPSSYIYDNEYDYYDQYNKSYFAYTCEKGGWDCLRHYEIIASGCLPVFDKVDHMPKLTMINWPIKLQYDVNQFFYKIEHGNRPYNHNAYMQLLNDMYNYAKENLKTTDSIKYMFSKL